MNTATLYRVLRILLDHRRSRKHCAETRAAIRSTIRALRRIGAQP